MQDKGLVCLEILIITGTLTDNSNYYIGSITSEPSRVFSPGGDIPVNAYGQEMQAPVYGPQELAQLYDCLLYTSPSPRDRQKSRMPSSA